MVHYRASYCNFAFIFDIGKHGFSSGGSADYIPCVKLKTSMDTSFIGLQVCLAGFSDVDTNIYNIIRRE